MKKIFCVVLAMMLVLGCVFAMTACGEENKAPVIPEGYKEIKVEGVSFAYPETWTKQDGSVTMLMDASGQNNITVVHTAKDGTYDDMTIEKFNSLMKPAYEALGLAISDVSLETVKTNGLSVLKIAFNTSASGVSMSQTQYITTVGDKTYAITVTEAQPDEKLVSTVLETLRPAE